MGNHAAGESFANMAKALASRRRDGETALEILDEAFKRADIDYGCDAEFDDATSPGDPFYDLINEAFAPEGKVYDFDDDEQSDDWYDNVYTKFRERYKLC